MKHSTGFAKGGRAVLTLLLCACAFLHSVVGAQPERRPAKATDSSPQPVSRDSAASARRKAVQETTTALKLPVANDLRQRLGSNEPIVLATWDGGKLTNQELSATMRLRRPHSGIEITPEQVFNLPAEDLRATIQDIAYEQIMHQKGVAAGINERDPEIARRLKDYRSDILEKVFYDEMVVPRLREAGEVAVKEFYEKNKDTLFIVPQYFVVRDIHVPIHRLHVARTGDTSSSLATSISGSAAAAKQILRGDPPFYWRFPLPEQVPSVALTAGESLLVPLSQDEVTSAERVAGRLRAKFAAGTSFDEIAKEFPQALVANGGRAFAPDFNGMVPEVVKAITAPEATTISQVMITPFGFTIIEIVDRQATRTLPLEQVREAVEKRVMEDPELRRREEPKIRRDVATQLSKKHKVVVNDDLLRRPDYAGPEAISGATPLASAADFAYTLDDLLNDFRVREKSWKDMTFEERHEAVASAPRLLRWLFEKEAEAMAVDRREDVAVQMRSRITQEIAAAYLRNTEFPTTETLQPQLREYYNAHLDRYTSPSMVTVREIVRRVNLNAPQEKRNADIEEAKKLLAGMRPFLKNENDFGVAARRDSQAISTRSRGGLVGTVKIDFRGPNVRAVLEKLRPGEVSEPVVYGAEIMLLRLDNVAPPVQRTFEQAENQVRREFFAETPKRLEYRKQEILTDARFKFQI